MSNLIQFKKSVANPTVPSLQPAEPGYTEALPGILHIGRSTGTNDTIRSFTDTAKTKLDAIEPGATADQTGAEIVTLIGGESNANVLTDAEKTKLAGLEDSKVKGRFTAADFPAALAALTTAYPNPADGSTAEISDGSTVKTAIWDGTDWVEDPAATPGETAASVKTKYESNADTNGFTDTEKAKLAGIEAGATANSVTSFVALTDTPNAAAMTASKGYIAVVNAAGTGIEYAASIDGGSF